MNDDGAKSMLNIQGERIALGPASRDHQDDYRRWFNDFYVQRTAGLVPLPWNKDAFDSFFTNRILKDNDDDAWFTVFENETSRPIGFSGIRDIDHRNRTAEFFVTIGEGDARGKGYGTKATILTLDYAFTALGLHNVMLDVLSASLAGIRAYEKAGFRQIGRRRECEMMGGRLWDMMFMECLSSEFESPVLKDVFKPDVPR
jgi:RimJ/RimL family protein N-acetyltransferase